MNTCAVMATVYTSDEEKEFIRHVADRFSRVNDMPVKMLKDSDYPGVVLAAPHYARYNLWDIVDPEIDRVIYLDTDILAMRPLPPLPDVDFAAVIDDPNIVENSLQFAPILEEANAYFNSGFFIATRKTQPIFRRLMARQMSMKNMPPPWYVDQTLLNIEIQIAVKRGEITFELLSPKWSFLSMRHPITAEDPYMLHFSGIPPMRKMRAVHHFIGYLNYVECEHGMKSGR